MRQPILPFIIIAVFAASLSLSFFLGRHYEQSERYGYGSHDTDAAKAQSQSEQAWDDDGKNSIRDGRSLSANGLDRWSRAVIADVKKKAVEIQTERRPTSSSSSSSSLPSSSTPQAPHQSKSADLTVIELPSLTDMASIGNLHVDVWKKECTKEPRFHIYGLMITGKDFFHYELAKRSVASFFNQTYSSKQLVVVNDSPEYSLAGLHPCLTEIRVVRKPTESFSLGTLRNVGINAVPTGSYWIQWDDDGNSIQFSTVFHSTWTRLA